MSAQLFRKSLGDYVDKGKAGLESLARVACQDLAEAVIDDTPLDTGFLVGNWQPSLQAPNLSLDESGTGNGYAQSKVGIIVAGLKAGDVFYYTNNAAYARRIEYGFVGYDSLGRYYNQRGRHMVTVNLKRWSAIVDGAAVKLGMAA